VLRLADSLLIDVSEGLKSVDPSQGHVGSTVLRPLVQSYLNGTASLESGINDAVWELGVSRAAVWRWIKRLADFMDAYNFARRLKTLSASHILRIHLQDLDFRPRSIHPKSDPPNARTEHHMDGSDFPFLQRVVRCRVQRVFMF
jgi:hypothetical protein